MQNAEGIKVVVARWYVVLVYSGLFHRELLEAVSYCYIANTLRIKTECIGHAL